MRLPNGISASIGVTISNVVNGLSALGTASHLLDQRSPSVLFVGLEFQNLLGHATGTYFGVFRLIGCRQRHQLRTISLHRLLLRLR